MPDATEPHDHEGPERAADANGKADIAAYQPGFLDGVRAALDAGFRPGEADPVPIDADDGDAVDAAWVEASQ